VAETLFRVGSSYDDFSRSIFPVAGGRGRHGAGLVVGFIADQADAEVVVWAKKRWLLLVLAMWRLSVL
jgi:hypothetical protein